MKTVDTYEEEHLKDLRRIADFCLMDDEFMSLVFENNPAAAQLVLRIILGDPGLVVAHAHTQETIKNLFGKDVVLDVFCTDSDGNSFNVEIQRNDQGAAPKRARYHASLVDGKLLAPSSTYKDLPEAYVIFVTENDYFRLAEPLYHIDRTVAETGLPFGDSQHIIYVNGQYTSDNDLGWLMHDFRCTSSRDMHYDVLRESVSYYKDHKEGTTAMCRSLEEMRNEYEEKGLQKGREQGRKQGLEQGEAIGTINNMKSTATSLIKNGISPEEIIRMCNYPADLVYEVASSLA